MTRPLETLSACALLVTITACGIDKAQDKFDSFCSDHQNDTALLSAPCKNSTDCCANLGWVCALQGSEGTCTPGIDSPANREVILSYCESFAASCQSQPTHCFHTELNSAQALTGDQNGHRGSMWILTHDAGPADFCFTHDVMDVKSVRGFVGISRQATTDALVTFAQDSLHSIGQASFDTTALNDRGMYVEVEVAGQPAPIRGQLVLAGETLFVGSLSGLVSGNIQVALSAPPSNDRIFWAHDVQLEVGRLRLYSQALDKEQDVSNPKDTAHVDSDFVQQLVQQGVRFQATDVSNTVTTSANLLPQW